MSTNIMHKYSIRFSDTKEVILNFEFPHLYDTRECLRAIIKAEAAIGVKDAFLKKQIEVWGDGEYGQYLGEPIKAIKFISRSMSRQRYYLDGLRVTKERFHDVFLEHYAYSKKSKVNYYNGKGYGYTEITYLNTNHSPSELGL